MAHQTAVIIGAGPAGVTAAAELADRTDIRPIVLEKSREVGGLSRTVRYNGNRIDIGGHRFFSKSDRVVAYWLSRFPLQGAPARDDRELGREVPLSLSPGAPDPEREDRVMLVRNRLSRIFYLRKFFSYPLSLNVRTFADLGLPRLLRIGGSYARARLFPRREERSLEDFFINRFGRELYATFFRDYTEKVWGVGCREIPAEWGVQRIRGLSLRRAIAGALGRRDASPRQRGAETSLIERFMYPKYGPGQFWEENLEEAQGKGAEVLTGRRAVGLRREGARVREVVALNEETGAFERYRADYVFSSMPVRDLVEALGLEVPADVARVARGLAYRAFITAGLLLREMRARNETSTPSVGGIVPDNWIYVQEKGVKLGRIQVFNNWSPYLVRDPQTVWLGLEYFCNQGDELWRLDDAALARFAARELASIGLADERAVLDSTVIRAPEAYPAYFGSYGRFATIRGYLDRIENLFPIGRNGMHRYNNQDHSMLSAMKAVDAILEGVPGKEAIWAVTAEGGYQEGGA